MSTFGDRPAVSDFLARDIAREREAFFAGLPDQGLDPTPLLSAAGDALLSVLVSDVFSGAPAGDARPFPFSRDENCGTPIEADGDGSRVHPEYREAFDRLDALASLGQACPALADTLPALRGEVARAMNRGIEAMRAGALSPYPSGSLLYVCRSSERPTRGEVRAWLGNFAAAVAKRCEAAHVADLSAAIAVASAPLDERGRSMSIGLALLVVLGLGALALVFWGGR